MAMTHRAIVFSNAVVYFKRIFIVICCLSVPIQISLARLSEEPKSIIDYGQNAYIDSFIHGFNWQQQQDHSLQQPAASPPELPRYENSSRLLLSSSTSPLPIREHVSMIPEGVRSYLDNSYPHIKAYLLPYFEMNNKSETVVALVSRNWQFLGQHVDNDGDVSCVFGNSSAIRAYSTAYRPEEQSGHQTSVVFCTFIAQEVEAYVQNSFDKVNFTVAHKNRGNVTTHVFLPFVGSKPVAGSNRGHHQAPRLTTCLTGYGKISDQLKDYYTEYFIYYKRVHGLDRVFLHTPDLEYYYAILNYTHSARFKEKCEMFSSHNKSRTHSNRLCPTITAIYMNNSHLHGKYWNHIFTIAHCWVLGMHLGSEWVMFNDIDEILTWPYGNQTWSQAFGDSVNAITFASWPFAFPYARRDKDLVAWYTSLNQSRGRSQYSDMILHTCGNVLGANHANLTYVDSPGECRFSPDRCCRCTHQNMGRRKYAIRSRHFRFVEAAHIHSPEVSRDPYSQSLEPVKYWNEGSRFYIHHVDAATSGLFLSHFRDSNIVLRRDNAPLLNKDDYAIHFNEAPFADGFYNMSSFSNGIKSCKCVQNAKKSDYRCSQMNV